MDIKGREITHAVHETDEGTLVRIDSIRHPDFWAEVMIPRPTALATRIMTKAELVGMLNDVLEDYGLEIKKNDPRLTPLFLAELADDISDREQDLLAENEEYEAELEEAARTACEQLGYIFPPKLKTNDILACVANMDPEEKAKLLQALKEV